MKTLALLIQTLIFLCLVITSCRTVKSTKQYTSTVKQTDTIIHRETIKLDTLRAAADSAKLSLPIALLSDTGINYLERSNGRATVKIQRIKDVIYATAHCDSLEKIIATKDRELQHLRTSTTTEKTTEKKVITKKSFWLQIWLYGSAVIVLAYLFIKFKTFLKSQSWVKIVMAKLRAGK